MTKGRMANKPGRSGRAVLKSGIHLGSSRGRMNARAENEYQRARQACKPEEKEQCQDDEIIQEDAAAVIDAGTAAEAAAETPEKAVSEPLPDAAATTPDDIIQTVPVPPAAALDDVPVVSPAVDPGVKKPETAAVEQLGDNSEELIDGQGVAVLQPVTGGVDCAARELTYSSGDGSVKPIDLPEAMQPVAYGLTPDEKWGKSVPNPM